MYKVYTQKHDKYGDIIVIERAEDGTEENPFRAMLSAFTFHRSFKEGGAIKVRFLVDEQIMTARKVEAWMHEEYQSLPKCAWCVKILNGDVYTHQLCGHSFFCSQVCADKGYNEATERLKDEEECDFR